MDKETENELLGKRNQLNNNNENMNILNKDFNKDLHQFEDVKKVLVEKNERNENINPDNKNNEKLKENKKLEKNNIKISQNQIELIEEEIENEDLKSILAKEEEFNKFRTNILQNISNSYIE